jgi:Arc/MetJ-type ribon-helix-helix transcriptional regulator
MMIHLPDDLEASIEAVVHGGRFASVDDAMAEAARLLIRQVNQERRHLRPAADAPDPLLGSMSDHADLMDQIVEDAMRHREQQPWRLKSGE